MQDQPEPPISFIARHPVIVGIIIGLIIGIPLLFYFGVYEPTRDGQNSQSNRDIIVVKNLRIRGNRNSHIYHLPDCPNYDGIAARNIVMFQTHEEARQAGYRMAKNCP